MFMRCYQTLSDVIRSDKYQMFMRCLSDVYQMFISCFLPIGNPVFKHSNGNSTLNKYVTKLSSLFKSRARIPPQYYDCNREWIRVGLRSTY